MQANRLTEQLLKGDLSAAETLADLTRKLNRLGRRVGAVLIVLGGIGLGCTRTFSRADMDSWVALPKCSGVLTGELVESTGPEFEDRTVYRLRADKLPQGRSYSLLLRKADGFIARDVTSVLIGNDGLIGEPNEDGEVVGLVLRFSQMLPDEPVGAGVESSDGTCARTVIVPRPAEQVATKPR